MLRCDTAVQNIFPNDGSGLMPSSPLCCCTKKCVDSSSRSLNKAGSPAPECAPADAEDFFVLPHIGASQPLGNAACSCEARRSPLEAVQQVPAAAADPISNAGAVHAQGHINAADQGSRDKTDWSISAQRAQPHPRPAAAPRAKGAPAATARASPEPHTGAAARFRNSAATCSEWD